MSGLLFAVFLAPPVQAESFADQVKGLWPTEDDLSFQYIAFLLGEAVNTLTGIGEGRSTTLSTIALTSIGSIFIALAGVYIALRTFKGVFEGAHQRWIWEVRSSYGVLGALIGFLVVIPLPALNGFCVAHTVPIYVAVTGIGLANTATARVLEAYGEHPLVALSAKKMIDPVAYQAALTMLNAHVCMRVINDAEGTRLHRSVESLARDNNDLKGVVPGVLPGLPPNPGAREYDAIVQEAAARYGVPPALIHAVITQESGYHRRARSPKGAMGPMQLMPGTAKDLGVTDPWDPYQNIMGGTRYLAQMLRAFNGDIALALAAYNAGPQAVKDHHGIPPYKETQDYVRKVMGNYNRLLAQGVPGGVAGTLHSRKIMWGGAPYLKNVCGELEYPVAYTMTQDDKVGTVQDALLTERDTLMEQLEQHMAALAQGLVDGSLSQDAMAQAILSAIMDFDFGLHRRALDTFDQYAQPAMDEFIEDVKTEGWSTLAEYFEKLAALQEAVAAASSGIEAKALAVPEAYFSERVGIMVRAHLARVEALVHRAHQGYTERQKIEMAREIAQKNGLSDVGDTIYGYVRDNHQQESMMLEVMLGDSTLVQQQAPGYAEYRRVQAGRLGEGGLPAAVMERVLHFLTEGSDRFPLLKYQEIGRWLLVGAAAGGAGSLFLPGQFGDIAAYMAGVLFTLGWFMAVFLPLLPLLVWYLAVLSWFINFLVLLLAAPVWGFFHVNLARTKPGYFALLRLLLYPAFLVMSLVVVAALLVVANAIIDKIIVSNVIRLVYSQEYVLAFGGFVLYALVVSATVVFVTRLMVIAVEKFFYAVSLEVSPAMQVSGRRLIAKFRKPFS